MTDGHSFYAQSNGTKLVKKYTRKHKNPIGLHISITPVKTVKSTQRKHRQSFHCRNIGNAIKNRQEHTRKHKKPDWTAYTGNAYVYQCKPDQRQNSSDVLSPSLDFLIIYNQKMLSTCSRLTPWSHCIAQKTK